jgi:hypothetical protein
MQKLIRLKVLMEWMGLERNRAARVYLARPFQKNVCACVDELLHWDVFHPKFVFDFRLCTVMCHVHG